MRHFLLSFCSAILVVFSFFSGLVRAEEGILVIHVADPQGRPIRGVLLSVKGDASISPPTDRAGKTRIRLALSTRSDRWVSLQVVRVLDGRDLVFIDPWNAQTRVPPFENESDNFVAIVLAPRGDRTILESGEAVKAIAANVLAAAGATSTTKSREEELQSALEKISQQYGLKPNDVHSAILAWGQKTQDTFEQGLVALYTKNYRESSKS